MHLCMQLFQLLLVSLLQLLQTEIRCFLIVCHERVPGLGELKELDLLTVLDLYQLSFLTQPEILFLPEELLVLEIFELSLDLLSF